MAAAARGAARARTALPVPDDAPLAALTDGLVALTAPVARARRLRQPSRAAAARSRRSAAARARRRPRPRTATRDPRAARCGGPRGRARALRHPCSGRRRARRPSTARSSTGPSIAAARSPVVCAARWMQCSRQDSSTELRGATLGCSCPQCCDIEQALLLLELEPPFDKRDVQLARRRLAKVWHPDLAPPGRQLEHERHLQGDQRGRRPARATRRGLARRAASRATPSRSAPPAARKRARRGGPPRLRGGAAPRARPTPTARKHDPFGSRVPDHSVVHRYARCLSYPGVGRRARVTGIYFTGERRRRPAVGAREVPARRAHGPGRLAAVRRLLQARPGRRARAALHDRRPARDGRGRLRARRAAPDLRARRRAAQRRRAAPDDARLLAGGRPRRRRPRRARLGARRARPPARRTASPRASTRTWARSTSPPRPPSAPPRARPADADAWERLGRLRLRLMRPRRRRSTALERARAHRPDASRACSTSRSPTTWPATSAPRSPPASRRRCSTPESRDGLVALRPRAGAHRPRQRRASRPASARSRSARRPRGRRPARAPARGAAARPARRVIAWVFDREALGAPPDGVDASGRRARRPDGRVRRRPRLDAPTSARLPAR